MVKKGNSSSMCYERVIVNVTNEAFMTFFTLLWGLGFTEQKLQTDHNSVGVTGVFVAEWMYFEMGDLS